jgi:uncharacterized protein with ParB-like and HNH nuclease domain
MGSENNNGEEILPFRLRPVGEMNNYIFYVNSYQRGYKWTSQEVYDLLNDIYDFTPDQGIYCLQPLVVQLLKPDQYELRRVVPVNQTVYELIDGQQRMTSIYMIMSFLSEEPDFCTIAYKTRDASELFLNNINDLPEYYTPYELLKEIPELITGLNAHWLDFIRQDANAELDNVDNYHFFQVYQTVKLWFSKIDAAEIERFKKNLMDFTNVIWYEIDSEETPENVFRKINSGKISLTNAELIKALFLISSKDFSNKELNEFRQNSIAHEWDRIENTLQDPEFWYFINEDPKKESFPTRIDFLFNILKKKDTKDKNKRDPYFTYRQYAKDIKEKKKLDWKPVKELFDQLCEWFEDRDVYHRMGFIISQKFKTIPELIELNKGHGKNYFKKALKDLIRNKFKPGVNGSSAYDLSRLHYENNKEEILAVLQLFNIETYQRSDSNFRFPFHRFKQEDWSIEHIHAQDAKQLTNGTQVKDWVDDGLELLNDILQDTKEPREKNLSLQAKLADFALSVSKDTLKALHKQQLLELSIELSEYLNTHKIGNLTLLDLQTNIAIGNKRFIDKRSEILKIDKAGGIMINDEFEAALIPVCTKNVFLKYYTEKTKDIQMHFWSARDRADYESAIEDILNYYYKP